MSALLISLSLCFSTLSSDDPALTPDVVIRGATLYDGTANPGDKGDVAIKGERRQRPNPRRYRAAPAQLWLLLTQRPHQYATGVKYLFVNGVLAIDGGTFQDKLAGRVLRHK